MKKFKSILALTASVLALSAFAAPVSAFAASPITSNDGETPTPNAGEQTLTDTVTGGFTVTIPADVNFATEATTVSSKELKADNGTTNGTTNPIILANGKVLNVYVKSLNGCELKQTGNTVDAIKYDITTTNSGNDATATVAASTLNGQTANIKGDNGTETRGVLLATFANKAYDTVNLTFTEGTKNVAAGEYSDTLTFTIAVADAPAGG